MELCEEQFDAYVRYHKKGDAGAESRCLSNLCEKLSLSEYDSFKLCYFHSITYNVPSALALLENPNVDKNSIYFRTDRHWVSIGNRFQRCMNELNIGKLFEVAKCSTTNTALKKVETWYYFQRYSACLFLEDYYATLSPTWADDITFDWKPDETYTLGAALLLKPAYWRPKYYNELLNVIKEQTSDVSFNIETSLCGWWKIHKGTRYDGYYTERLLNEAARSSYSDLIMECAIG